MNFAYLDARGLLESLLAPPPADPVIPEPCELDAEWKDFEKELGNFKSKFVKTRAELTRLTTALNTQREEINVIKMMIENVSSDGLKAKLSELVDKHESEQDIEELTQKCRVVAGRLEAQKRVLMDTNAEKYGKFTCFVCMDRLVDLFIDPCGHVICERCWVRTPTKDKCPGCRATPNAIRKIFTMN